MFSRFVLVTEFAKKTGDYSVLSHADLCVLALAYVVDMEAKARETHQTEVKVHSHAISFQSCLNH